jgi:hypothetical protein
MDLFSFKNKSEITPLQFKESLGFFLPETNTNPLIYEAIDFEYNKVDQSVELKKTLPK